MINWIKLKREVSINLKKVFENSTNPYYANFEEGLELFQQIVMLKTNNLKLDGTTRTILPALNDAYITKKGDLNSLNILSTQLEAYLKKIILLKDANDYSNNYLKSLAPLIVELDLSKVLSTKGQIRYQDLLTESNLNSFKGQDEFIEHICQSYLIRNQVHNSPDWDTIEILTNLRSILVVYIYATLKHLPVLKSKLNNYLNQHTTTNIVFDERTKILYNFITYGNNTIEIKQQLITSFIINHLSTNFTESVENLCKLCNESFNINAEKSFYTRLLQNLTNQQRVFVTDSNRSIFQLTSSEIEKIKIANEDFKFREQILIIDVQNELEKFGIKEVFEAVIFKLKELFEKNYNLDISEIYDNSNSNNNSIYCREFVDFLRSKVNNKEKVEELFFNLLLICEQNDFLHRISLGNVFADINNPIELQNYIRITKREVYIDTQLIIYALCYWYKDTNYENVYYRITKELLDLKEQNQNLRIYASTLYINEAAYHLKEALLLVPFEDLNIFKIAASNNVFFKFYLSLKDSKQLDDEIETFENFLKEFDLYYDDIYDKNYIQIATDLITQYLESLDIEIVEIPKLDKEPAVDIFKSVLQTKDKTRQEVTVNNDAIMLSYLSNNSEHEVEPIFITWDTTFYDARKKYFEKFRGCDLWHLFSPSKFLNHISLLEFEVNPQSLSNDFYSILHSSDIQNKTENVIDSLTALLDIDKQDKRKYINKLKEFGKTYVFTHEKDSEIIEQEQSQPIEILINKLTFYYRNSKTKKHSFEDLKSIFSESVYFEQITSIIQRELENLVNYNSDIDNVYKQMDILIDNKKDKNSIPFTLDET